MDNFGLRLRQHREQARDPTKKNRRLSQQRLGELLGQVRGDDGVSGATISNWELDNAKIDKDDRQTLTTLIQILYECHGLHSLDEANTLLHAGNYRALDGSEQQRLFPNEPAPLAPTSPTRLQEESLPAGTNRQLFVTLWRELRTRPGFPEQIIITPLHHWTPHKVFWTTIWLGLWLLTWFLTLPLLHWPPAGDNDAQTAATLHLIGSNLIPLLTGLLFALKHRSSPLPHTTPRQFAFFAWLGALAGFTFGYASLSLLRLVAYYLGLANIPPLLAGLAALWLIICTVITAQQLPPHVHHTFGSLRITEGDVALLLLLSLPGLALGLTFATIYPWLLTPTTGTTVILSATMLISAIHLWQPRQLNILLPVLASLLIGIFFINTQAGPLTLALTSGSIAVTATTILRKELHATLAGVSLALGTALVAAWLWPHQPIIASMLTLIVLALWLWQGQQLLRLPASLWLTILAAGVTIILVARYDWPEYETALLFAGAITLLLLTDTIRHKRQRKKQHDPKTQKTA